MGAVKQMLIEEWEDERNEQVREWLMEKLGRPVTQAEIDAAWSDFELDEAYQQALDKDD